MALCDWPDSLRIAAAACVQPPSGSGISTKADALPLTPAGSQLKDKEQRDSSGDADCRLAAGGWTPKHPMLDA
jgi:hypothetical protein